MSLLHIILFLVLGLSVNSLVASPDLFENTSSGSFQKIQPLLVAEKPDSRRRGLGCTIPPNVWTIAVCENMRFCYIDPAKVNLWLPPNKWSLGNNKLKIQNSKNEAQQVEQVWKPSEETLLWPVDEVPIQSEATYLITLTNLHGRNSYSITLYEVPGELSEVSDQATWMIEKGCTRQGDRLIEPMEG